MWDPQGKLQRGIVRVNLDSKMSQVVLVSVHGFGNMAYCGLRFCMLGRNTYQAFIRLE